MSGSEDLLAGVRVVELAQYVYGPSTAAMFADMGADVIKVETPGGDPYRALRVTAASDGAPNLGMELNNHGKRSIVIDLKRQEGADLLDRLLGQADVFVTSLRPGAVARLGFGPETVRQRHPRLIYARVNGHGFGGAEADRPAYDASAFWARGGFARVLAQHGGRPPAPRGGLGDHAAALALAFGIASALFHRERTGEARLVEGSLLGTAMWILSSDITRARMPGYAEFAAPGPSANPLCEPYRTRDGRWIQLVFIEPDRYWRDLCAHLDIPEAADDPRFVDARARAANAGACHDAIAAAFAGRDFAEWKSRLATLSGPWEPVASIAEVADDPAGRDNGYLFDLALDNGTEVMLVAGPVVFDGQAITARRPAPGLGADTDAILDELGCSDQTIADLRAAGIVA